MGQRMNTIEKKEGSRTKEFSNTQIIKLNSANPIENEDNRIRRCSLAWDDPLNEEINEFNQKVLLLSYDFIRSDIENVGIISFMKSFETLPEIKEKFKLFRNLPYDDLSTNHALRSHTNKVMGIIDQVINALKNKKLNAMRDKLISLGERHHIYGVKKEFLAIIEYQFIKAVEPIMYKNLDKLNIKMLCESDESNGGCLNETEKSIELINIAWHKLFGFVRECMCEGLSKFSS